MLPNEFGKHTHEEFEEWNKLPLQNAVVSKRSVADQLMDQFWSKQILDISDEGD